MLLGFCILVTGAFGCGGNPVTPTATFKVVSISPPHGSSLGGDRVAISGDGFPASVQVLVGGVAAIEVTVRDSSSISVVTPSHEVGTVDVDVVSGQQRSTLARGFTYEKRDITNAAPQLTSLVAQGTRPNQPASYAAVGERINVTASVTDDVTPISALTLQWSVDNGRIEGSGDHVTFVAGSTSGTAHIGLTIIERYKAPDSRGLPTDVENKTMGALSVSVHDEVNEIGDMAVDFLRLFSMSSVAPTDVVHNFRDSCGANGTGKQDELSQIVANRRNFTILPDWYVGSARTQVSFGGVSPFRARRSDGWAAVDVRWHAECRVRDDSIGCPYVGASGTTSGTDWVTAIYDANVNRWWLCDSDYNGTGTGTLAKMFLLPIR